MKARALRSVKSRYQARVLPDWDNVGHAKFEPHSPRPLETVCCAHDGSALLISIHAGFKMAVCNSCANI